MNLWISEKVETHLQPVVDQEDKPEFSLDLSNLELSQIVKHRRITEAEDLEEKPSGEASVSNDKDNASGDAVDEYEVDSNFKTPKPRCRKFIFKPFQRNSINGSLEHDNSEEPVDVVISEQLARSYGLYLWPSAPVLAW